jgi:hypothetical protein
MFIDITLGGSQVALLVLKLMGIFSGSWWLVFVPSFVWLVGGILANATGKNEKN